MLSLPKAICEHENSRLRVKWPNASANSPTHKCETNGSHTARIECGACRFFQDSYGPRREDLPACNWLRRHLSWKGEPLAALNSDYAHTAPNCCAMHISSPRRGVFQ